MSSDDSLLPQRVQLRFRQALGQPRLSIGKDHHWSLQPTANMAAINVLLNGEVAKPSVWVFDPHDLVDGVAETAIESEAQVDGLIAQIRERVRAASRRPRAT